MFESDEGRFNFLKVLLHTHLLKPDVNTDDAFSVLTAVSPPPLCGASPASSDYVAKQGDKVAARVKAVEGDEQWILAEVVSYNHSTNK